MRWLLTTVLLLSTMAAQAEIIAIGGSEAPESIDRASLTKIFMGKKKRWGGGAKVQAVTLKRGAELDIFLKRFLGKSNSEFTTYWKRMIFTGRGKPPKSFRSQEELVDFIKEHPGAVGFIDSETPHEGIKVIKVQ